ncbi:helix-turn-helix transcriptional regulator [Quadrisphaera sp. DSM 44207]|uniref:helix-turn-helix transcriptional regulator n=1 Tax=Quadrisphaera sp. DSM 44207 TaxID=1881057 RepID=UPI00088A6F7F|nr:helix-turn-helix transcriptional regulator [Quadrisphaera sp. DSM 44207]SDQ78200.1 DNA-binding transcriptional regulator, XRE-family HTH domain [Quadrisphaera sp. DSM 44207]
MAKKRHTFSRPTLDAVHVLGAQVAQARRARGWTAAELAERVGVSPRTITSLERGAPTVALGTAFEAATLLRIPLFGAEGPELAALAHRERQVLALLPRRVHRSREPAHDDF